MGRWLPHGETDEFASVDDCVMWLGSPWTEEPLHRSIATIIREFQGGVRLIGLKSLLKWPPRRCHDDILEILLIELGMMRR